MSDKRHSIALILVFLSMTLSAVVSRSVFERLPHLEDEVAYLFQAKTYAGGQLVIDSPEPRRPFWQPFVVDYSTTGKRFSKYSPGWPALLTLGVLMGQPWIINTFLSGLTVALVYRMAREIYDTHTGVIAAALTAFSPMALLLNGTLMGHTAALFTITLFMYAYWRMERSRNPLRWGLVAGIGLGLTIVNRPLTAIGMSVPFVVWSTIRLIRPFLSKSKMARIPAFIFNLKPLATLAGTALVISLIIPVYNYAATGDLTKNLYTLVWPYDRIGFGAAGEYGRSGHTLEKGIRHVRFDLSLMAADLYGWQLGSLTTEPFNPVTIKPELSNQLLNEGDYWPIAGISWILLPFGLILGARQRWTWLLAAASLSLIILHVAYWIGSQRYSTRYYFETLTALSILSAIPIGWLLRQIRPNQRWLIYGLTLLALLYSFYAYSIPRISVLNGFNFINQERINTVLERRTDDRPVLVLMSGTDVRWRAMGPFMALTSPYLDSEVVVAWDNQQPDIRDAILALFPDRQVIEMEAEGNQAWFKGENSG